MTSPNRRRGDAPQGRPHEQGAERKAAATRPRQAPVSSRLGYRDTTTEKIAARRPGITEPVLLPPFRQ